MSQRKIKKHRLIEKAIVKETEIGAVAKHSIRDILWENWKYLFFISIVVFLFYINSLNGDFVSDDYATILNNPMVDSLSVLSGNVTPVVFTNYLIAKLIGVFPFVYHLFSVLFYMSILWLLFVFLNFIVSQNLARVTIALFALMPVHVEAVAWISGKPYLFLAFLIITAFIGFVKYLEDGKYWYLVVSGISFILAVMTDPPRPFSLLFIILLYLMVVNNKVYWQKFLKLIPLMLVVVTAALLTKLPLMLNRINIVNSGYNSSESIFYNPLFQYPTGIPKYLQLLWAPIDMTLYHTMYIFPVWLNWLIFINFFGLIFYFYHKDKRIFFGLVFFLVTLLPSMAPVKVSWLVAERYAFLPSLGFCMFLAVILEDFWNRNKYVPVVLAAVFISTSGVRTYFRNIDWQTNHKLWVNTCQVSPNSHNAWNNIGDDYDKLKQYDNAIKGFTQSTVVKPNYADAFHNRANIFYKTGRLDLARDSYNTALYFSPTLYQTYLSLTQIDLMENRIDLAMEHAKKATEISPNDPQAAYVMAVVYAQAGQVAQAQVILESVLKVAPGFKQASDALNAIKAQIGTGKS